MLVDSLLDLSDSYGASSPGPSAVGRRGLDLYSSSALHLPYSKSYLHVQWHDPRYARREASALLQNARKKDAGALRMRCWVRTSNKFTPRQNQYHNVPVLLSNAANGFDSHTLLGPDPELFPGSNRRCGFRKPSSICLKAFAGSWEISEMSCFTAPVAEDIIEDSPPPLVPGRVVPDVG